MSGIEEQIRVSGADKAKADLDQVAAAQERVSETVEDAGRKGGGAGQEFTNLNDIHSVISVRTP